MSFQITLCTLCILNEISDPMSEIGLQGMCRSEAAELLILTTSLWNLMFYIGIELSYSQKINEN